jgi:hypothetical protein
MNVHLTFDIEVWCDGWDRLDQTFPTNFERYVYGKSSHGEFALPKTLEILNKAGLRGVFFVEPLFAARFGIRFLQTIVQLIQDAGQEVQLHLHPEWTDEIRPAILEDVAKKRQHLTYYSLQEQTDLIAFGRKLLMEAGCANVTAFRAGSFAANVDTMEALQRNGILIDSSLNRCYPISGGDFPGTRNFDTPFLHNKVTTYPVTVFKDGFGSDRPTHIAACSFEEVKDALRSAKLAGWTDFVIVSHNFEMLKPGTSEPSWTVVRRFEQLCAFLAASRQDFPVTGYAKLASCGGDAAGLKRPTARLSSTLKRHVEQAISRVH